MRNSVQSSKVVSTSNGIQLKLKIKAINTRSKVNVIK